MTLYQIEIDAPVLLRVEAEDEEEAGRLGDAAYASFWEKMDEAVTAHAEETNTDANLGARYDNTDVGVVDPETGDVR